MTDAERHEMLRELVITARRWRTRCDERLRAMGLSEARSAALYWLSQSPEGLSQSALAERAGVENPTLVRTLDLLCEAGLVDRRASPHDRRAKVVALTPAAGPLVRQMDVVSAELRGEIMPDLTLEEAQVVLRVLRKMRFRLDGDDRGPPALKSA